MRAFRTQSPVRCFTQPLEPRVYLKITPHVPRVPGYVVEIPNQTADIVEVIGTAGDDVIGVHREADSYVIIVNSLDDTRRFSLSGLLGVRFHLFGGDDCLVIQQDDVIPVTVFAGDGDDKIFTAAGDDRIEGGAGRDSLYGNGGNDRIYGDGGADRIFGGSGRDFLFGGTGRDRSDRDTRDRRRESIELFF